MFYDLYFRKWHAVLWIVCLAMALSSLSFLFWRSPGIREITIATINGQKIRLKDYQRTLYNIQQQVLRLREYARLLGISESLFLKSYYNSFDPQEIAMETMIKETLLDQVKNPFKIEFATDDFMDELVKTIPQGIVDSRGRLNMNAYQNYLASLQVTPTEFEQEKEEEFKRNLVENFVSTSYYVPHFYARQKAMEQQLLKRFNIVVFPYKKYLDQQKKKTPDPKELKQFYEKHKEQYRIPKRKKVWYWKISPKDYEKQVEVNENAVKNYYTRNKSSFRIPPKVRVRHILLKPSPDKSNNQILSLAQKLHSEVKQYPDRFSKLAQKHSQNEKTAKNGGLTDFFKSGTRDRDFEQAAFRLHDKGEISGIVKIQDGYEIIQLDERIKASTKSIDQVHDEIVALLKAKKSLSMLKTKLETALRDAKTGKAKFVKFAEDHKLGKLESSWIFKDLIDKPSFEGQLANRLFGDSRQRRERGYFFDGGIYTLYQLSESEKSYVKKFDDIKEKLLAQYHQTIARENLKISVKEARSKVFNKKALLPDIAKEDNLKFLQTNYLKFGDQIDELKNLRTISSKIFNLNDISQLMQYQHENDYYLIQLEGSREQKYEKDIQKENIAQIIKNEKMAGSTGHTSGFIASLRRNAKIDVDPSLYKGNL